MKNYFFTLMAIAICLVGCNSADKYTLKCTLNEDMIEDFAESNVVTYVRREKQWIALDSATINSNGEFKLTGKVEQPEVALLTIDDIEVGEFVREVGDLEGNFIDFGAFVVSGSANNEILNSFNAKVESFMSEEEFSAYLYDFLKENINNIVGSYTFCNNYIILTTSQIEEIIGLMTDETKTQPQMQFVLSKIEVMLQTSEGQPYQDISLLAPDGSQMAISDLVGKTDYLLVDFWASWCGPCRRAMPQVIELYDKYHPEGKLDILGISLDNDADAWKMAIEGLGLKWNHISDLKGWQSEAAILYGVSAIPSTVLINHEGKIVARNLELNQYEPIIKGQE